MACSGELMVCPQILQQFRPSASGGARGSASVQARVVRSPPMQRSPAAPVQPHFRRAVAASPPDASDAAHSRASASPATTSRAAEAPVNAKGRGPAGSARRRGPLFASSAQDGEQGDGVGLDPVAVLGPGGLLDELASGSDSDGGSSEEADGFGARDGQGGFDGHAVRRSARRRASVRRYRPAATHEGDNSDDGSGAGGRDSGSEYDSRRVTTPPRPAATLGRSPASTGRRYRCGRCHEFGHNTRTCTSAAAPDADGPSSAATSRSDGANGGPAAVRARADNSARASSRKRTPTKRYIANSGDDGESTGPPSHPPPSPLRTPVPAVPAVPRRSSSRRRIPTDRYSPTTHGGDDAPGSAPPSGGESPGPVATSDGADEAPPRSASPQGGGSVDTPLRRSRRSRHPLRPYSPANMEEHEARLRAQLSLPSHRARSHSGGGESGATRGSEASSPQRMSPHHDDSDDSDDSGGGASESSHSGPAKPTSRSSSRGGRGRGRGRGSTNSRHHRRSQAGGSVAPAAGMMSFVAALSASTSAIRPVLIGAGGNAIRPTAVKPARQRRQRTHSRASTESSTSGPTRRTRKVGGGVMGAALVCGCNLPCEQNTTRKAAPPVAAAPVSFMQQLKRASLCSVVCGR